MVASALVRPFPLPEFLFAPLFSCSLSSGFCSCAPLPPGWRLLSLHHLTSAAVPFSVPPPFTTAVHTHLFPHRRFYQRPSVPVASGVVPFCALLVSLSPRPALFSPLSGPSCALLYQPAFLFASLFSCSHLFPWPSFLLAPFCSLAFCTSRRFFSRPSFPVRTSSLGRRFFSRPSVPLLSRPSRQV